MHCNTRLVEASRENAATKELPTNKYIYSTLKISSKQLFPQSEKPKLTTACIVKQMFALIARMAQLGGGGEGGKNKDNNKYDMGQEG